MNTRRDYAIDTDVAYGYLKLIDLEQIRREVRDDWFNQTLCGVNDCVVRIGVVQGEFHWHKHDHEDEFFLVIDGRLYVDLESETIELTPHQGFTVPRGVWHRTRAPGRTAMLMVEGATVTATGDV